MVLGSRAADVQNIINSRDLPGMAGFDHELKTLAARRRRAGNGSVQLPAGKHRTLGWEHKAILKLPA